MPSEATAPSPRPRRQGWAIPSCLPPKRMSVVQRPRECQGFDASQIGVLECHRVDGLDANTLVLASNAGAGWQFVAP